MKKICLLLCLLLACSSWATADPKIYYVAPEGTGDGSSWNSPLGSIKTAYDKEDVTEVHVKTGSYSFEAITLKSGVHLLGGYTGNEEERVSNPALTVWNGNENQDGAQFITSSGLTATATVSGITFQGSTAGAMTIGANTVLDNVIIKNNTGVNATDGCAAGVFVTGAEEDGKVVIKNSQFIGNTISGASANIAGAIFVHSNSLLDVINCVFDNNSATTTGSGYTTGGIGSSSSGSSPTGLLNVINSTFVNNKGVSTNSNSAGAIHVRYLKTNIYSSVFAGNTNTNGGTKNLYVGSSTKGVTTAYSCYLKGSWGGTISEGNITPDAVALSDLFTEGNYIPSETSPLVDAGSEVEGQYSATDITGTAVSGTKRDIGAYERLPIIEDAVDVSVYENYAGDIIFRSDDAATGQLISEEETSFTPQGKVKLIKTFKTGQWYPIGFPFEIDNSAIAIKYGENSTTGVIYNGDKGSHTLTEDGAGNGAEANLFVKEYDGVTNYFVFTDAIAANTGYFVEFPADKFGDANEIEVTFVSESSPTLKIGSVGDDIPSDDENDYFLVANSNVNNISSFSGAGNYYQYDYAVDNPRFVPVDDNDQPEIKPFEAIIAVKDGITGELRSTIGDGSGVITHVTGITLDETSAELEVNETLQLTATIAPDNATNQGVTWSSDNEPVASVTNDGLVTAHTVGTATITVTTDDGGLTSNCEITVIRGTGTESPDSQPARASYVRGLLRLVNLNGYSATLFAVDGQTLAQFQIDSVDASVPQTLPNGVYFLLAQKGADRKVFKLIAHSAP